MRKAAIAEKRVSFIGLACLLCGCGVVDTAQSQSSSDPLLLDELDIPRCPVAILESPRETDLVLDDYIRNMQSPGRYDVEVPIPVCEGDLCFSTHFEPVGSTAGWRRIFVRSLQGQILASAKCFKDVLPRATCSIRVQMNSAIASGEIPTGENEQVYESLECLLMEVAKKNVGPE